MNEKWSKNVHPQEGALRRYGWSESAPAEVRHHALEESAKRDGYATTMERLDFMANVANHRDNEALYLTAAEDRAWFKRWERVDEDDRQRARGAKHRVETYRTSDGRTVHAHLAYDPGRKP